MPAVGLGGACPQRLVAELLGDLDRARRRLDPARDLQAVGQGGRDAGLEVAARLARRAALEHRARGVEVAERAPDVEVVGVDRVDQRVRLPEPRVGLRRALVVAQLDVERQRALEVGDLAPEVAGDGHELRERDQEPRAHRGVRTGAVHDGERPVPVRGRVLPREQLARSVARPQRAVDRRGGIAGRPGEAVVQRERGEGAHAVRDRGRRAGVHALAARDAERAVERLAHERVRERVAAGGLDDEPRLERLLERDDHLVLVAVSHRPQRREVELAAEHGGVGERRPAPFREPREAPQQHLPHALGHADLVGGQGLRPAAGLEQVPHDLLDEEGVAVGLGADRADQCRRRLVPGLVGDQRGDGRLVEAGERDDLEQPVAPQVGEQLAELGRRLALALRADDQQRRLVLGAQDVAQELERRTVGPVQVVEHEQDRRAGSGVAQEPRDGLEHEVAPCLGILRRRARRGIALEPGDQLRELRRAGGAGVADVVAEGFDERLVGEQRLLRAAPVEHGALGVRGPRELGGQARLADPGRAGEHHEAAPRRAPRLGRAPRARPRGR